MAATTRIEIKLDNTEAIKNATQKQLQVALETIGLKLEGYAKTLCPVDTGNLRNSITHETKEKYTQVGTNVEYAVYVEMGTRKMKAQPYLRPATENHLQEYKTIIEDALKR